VRGRREDPGRSHRRRDRGQAGGRALNSVETVFREEWSRVLATLIGVLGDFELAEDALQDAIATALERWPRDGTPENPGAWLIATARNRAIDRIRRERTLARKTELLQRLAQLESQDDEDDALPDERLSLIFTCCHPALAPEAQVALTLRAVGGLATTEIARAFLVPETTMGQRLVRAQRQLRDRAARARRPLRGGDPAREAARRADAGRARGARIAGADALPRLPARGTDCRGRQPDPARGSGSRPLESRPDRRGRPGSGPGA